MTGYQMTGKVLVLVVMTVQGWTKAAPVDSNDSNVGVFYDQRQSGEYNIHVIVKDVDIVAFLGEGVGDYEDYDYSYDYHVPQNPWEASSTTQKTSSTTSAEQNSSTTQKTSSATSAEQNSSTTQKTSSATSAEQNSSTTQKSSSATSAEQNSSLSSLTIPASSVSPIEDTTSTILKPISSTEGSTLSCNTTVECSTSTKEPEDNQQEQGVNKGSGKGRRRCSAGFVRDNRGRCRRQRKPGQQYTALQLPFGLRLFPRPLVQMHPDNS